MVAVRIGHSAGDLVAHGDASQTYIKGPSLGPNFNRLDVEQMKRGFLAGVLATLLVSMLAACGGNSTGNEVKQEPPTPPDLTGEWKQTNSNSEDAWQSAEIADDTIEVYWVSDNGETKALYWAGTYTAPTTADEPYTWQSENDKAKTDTALLASGDDTKGFTYQGGVLSYDVTAMGVTQTVKLEKVK